MSRRLLAAVAILAIGASVVPPARTAAAAADIDDALLRDVGGGLTLAGDQPDASGTHTRTWRGDRGELAITGFSVTTPPGVRPLFDAIARTSLGLEVVTEPSLALGAWLVEPGGAPGDDGIAALVVASRDHLFEIHLTSTTMSGADVAAFVLDVAHRQVEAAGGPPAGARPRDVDDEALLAFIPDAPPPGFGLGPESVTVTGEDELDAAESASPKVVDFINDRSANAARVWIGGDLSLAIGITRYPYDIFAATGLGEVGDRDAASTAVPSTIHAADAVVLHDEASRQVGVVFRRGEVLVTVLVDHRGTATPSLAEQLAVDAANLVDERLPADGGTGPYQFPSPPSKIVGLGLTAAFVTAAVGGSRAVAWVRARRVRRRWTADADTPATSTAASWPSPVAGSIVGLDDDAAALRRRGRVVSAVNLLTVNVVVVALAGDFAWPGVIVAALALMSGLVFGWWWLRREQALLGAAAPRTRFVLPRLPGALMLVVALTVLGLGVGYMLKGLRYLVLKPTLAQLKWSDRLDIAPRTVGVAFAIGGVAVVAIGAVLFRFARGLLRARVRATLRADRRPPVLYLRSFGDDGVPLPVIASARRPLFELFSIRGADPFEEAIASELGGYGPVVSVGRPGGTLVSRGAAREHLAQDTWRDQIADRMRDAALIVLAPGETAGVAWELGEIVNGGHLPKTVFVFPPLRPGDLDRRWQHTAGVLRHAGAPPAPLPASAAVTHTVRIDELGNAHVTVASARDEATYRVGVDRAVEPLTASPALPAPAEEACQQAIVGVPSGT